MSESKVSDMLAELAAGGELVDEGEFTLDAGRARDKLRKFRLTDPTSWVLLAVEAASLGGASCFDLDAGNDSYLDLEGLFLDKHELEGLLASVLVDTGSVEDSARRRRAECLRLLALAVDAAMETGATRVAVGSTDGDRSCTLTVGQGQESSFESSRGGRGDRVFTRIIVDRRGLSGDQGQRESRLVRERARWAEADVRIAGERISEGMEQALFPLQPWSTDASGTPVPVSLEDGTPIGWCGIRRLSRTSPDYDWVLVQTHGVLIEQVPVEEGDGFVAIIDVPVERDLSLQSVVRNEKWDRYWAAVMRGRDAAEALRPAKPPRAPASSSNSGRELLLQHDSDEFEFAGVRILAVIMLGIFGVFLLLALILLG